MGCLIKLPHVSNNSKINLKNLYTFVLGVVRVKKIYWRWCVVCGVCWNYFFSLDFYSTPQYFIYKILSVCVCVCVCAASTHTLWYLRTVHTSVHTSVHTWHMCVYTTSTSCTTRQSTQTPPLSTHYCCLCHWDYIHKTIEMITYRRRLFWGRPCNNFPPGPIQALQSIPGCK